MCGAQALASNNLERVASTMDQFERQFENLDVQSQFVEGAMNNQASLSTPEEDVNLLLQQVRMQLLPSTLLSQDTIMQCTCASVL